MADGIKRVSTPENIPETSMTEVKALDELAQRILELNLGAEAYAGNSDCPAVQAPADGLLKLMTELKNNEKFKFEMLSSHTAVDRIESGMFELVYYLFSLTHQKHLLVSVLVPRGNPVVPTMCGIWKTAEWQEREVYDLFGIGYDNHPDLRRVFLEDEWKGFPLRKDYKDDFMLSKESKESKES